jgi:pyruvate formate lyase activating enzyme
MTRDLTNYRLVETRLQEQLPNGTARCNLCLWRCKIGHGQRGFCQAHVNRNGTLYNLSYGILSSIDIDPIEDKPVRHFRPGTRVMSVGSYGCSFRCGGCHNLDISWGVEALDTLARGESTEVWVTPERLVEAAVRSGVQGIAFTYSEPAVWLEYVIDVCELAQAAGLYTVYVSNSFVTDEALELVAPHLDVLCSDIKSLSDEFYREICRPATVEQVETRTNIIPGKNDDAGEHFAIARWVRDNLGAESPWHITRFFPAYRLSHLPPTPDHVLMAAAEQGRQAGLRHVYVYNDKGCDCAAENRPVEFYLNSGAEALHQVKKCPASCCGDDGILLKKYEQSSNPE